MSTLLVGMSGMLTGDVSSAPAITQDIHDITDTEAVEHLETRRQTRNYTLNVEKQAANLLNATEQVEPDYFDLSDVHQGEQMRIDSSPGIYRHLKQIMFQLSDKTSSPKSEIFGKLCISCTSRTNGHEQLGQNCDTKFVFRVKTSTSSDQIIRANGISVNEKDITVQMFHSTRVCTVQTGCTLLSGGTLAQNFADL